MGGGGGTWWVNISQKTSWLSIEAEERGSDKGGRLTTDPSPWVLWCRVTSDRQPHFTSDPAQIWNRWTGCIHTADTLLFCFPCFIPRFSSMASPLHPLLLGWCSTLPIYFHLPHALHSPRSPPNRQGCCGWHVSSWEQPCRVDGPQYAERRDSPTTQPSVCVSSGFVFF